MTGSSPVVRSQRAGIAACLLLFVAACAAAFYLIVPLRAGQIGFDAAASVVYFDRLVQGRHLEAFITATPKPLLTVVYGVLYNLFHDWRPISWLVIAVFGLSAVLAAILAGRFGGLPAAAFAGVAVIGSQSLVQDVSLSYAVVWAFVGCLLAGLAVTGTRPRYAWAGVALAIAALARFEVMLLIGLCAVVLGARWLWWRRRGGTAPDRRAWLVLVGLAALPVQFVHDWLLTGNALYAEHVPTVASVGLPLLGPLETVNSIGQHLLGEGALVALAAVGTIALIRRRAWPLLVGLTAMGPGVAAFLVFLAARRIYISGRYFDPIDLAVIVAAAVGFGAVVVPDLVAIGRRVSSPGRRTALLGAGAVVAAILFSAPFAPLNKPVFLAIRTNLDIERNAAEALPAVRRAMAAIPGVTDWPGPTDGRLPALFVPTLLRPQFAVDLGLPITQVSGTAAARLGTDGSYPVAGQVIVHDQYAEPDPAFDFLEVDRATTIGRIVITPLLSDPARGIWVDRIDPAP